MWKKLESSRTLRHWLPWRPDVRNGQTEEDCEDPERLVLFDDLSPVLFRIEEESNKLQLVLNYLELIGFPSFLEPSFPFDSELSILMQQFELENICDINCNQTLTSQIDPKGCCAKTNVGEDSSKYLVMEGCLKQALNKFTGDSKTKLTVLLIKLKLTQLKSGEVEWKKDKKLWKQMSKELKKWVKEILKSEENRNNLKIWQAYSSIETHLGNINDGLGIFDTAVSMNCPESGLVNVADKKLRGDLLSVCKMYAGIGLGIESRFEDRKVDKNRVLHLLSSIPESEKYSVWSPSIQTVPATKVVRSRRNYQKMIDVVLTEYFQSLNDERIGPDVLECIGSTLVNLTACFGYFQYLSIDIHAASVVFQQVS